MYYNLNLHHILNVYCETNVILTNKSIIFRQYLKQAFFVTKSLYNWINFLKNVFVFIYNVCNILKLSLFGILWRKKSYEIIIRFSNYALFTEEKLYCAMKTCYTFTI